MGHYILTDQIIVMRLLLSFVAGFVIGLERSAKRQVAGLRTHILICIGATGVMLLSIWVTQMSGKTLGDPGRIAAQVVSGMGFLGGGAILKIGANIKGLTTATSIWVVAGIGLLIGGGLYTAGITLVILSIITLTVLSTLESKIFPAQQTKRLEIQFSDTEPHFTDISKVLKKHSIDIISTNVNSSNSKESHPKLIFLVSVPKDLNVRKFNHDLHSLNHVRKIALKEVL